jgi:uncharacterized membrane protein
MTTTVVLTALAMLLSWLSGFLAADYQHPFDKFALVLAILFAVGAMLNTYELMKGMGL